MEAVTSLGAPRPGFCRRHRAVLKSVLGQQAVPSALPACPGLTREAMGWRHTAVSPAHRRQKGGQGQPVAGGRQVCGLALSHWHRGEGAGSAFCPPCRPPASGHRGQTDSCVLGGAGLHRLLHEKFRTPGSKASWNHVFLGVPGAGASASLPAQLRETWTLTSPCTSASVH